MFVVIAVALSLALGGTFLGPSPLAAGMQESDNSDEPVSGTPVAADTAPHDPLDSDPSQGASIAGDPLDGDSLDGMPVDGDPSDPVGQRPLEVLRSARPHDEPTATVVYDGDPQTVWTPHADADETWLWLDLGVERRLREVRVLAQGSGTAEIALSSDRRQWRDVDQIDVGGGWQELEMRDDARYVRLTLLPTDDGGDLPAIAEVALYGSDRSRSVSSERQVSSGRDRQSRGDRKSAAEQKAESADASGRNEGRREPRSKDRVQTSVEPGGTRCRGDRGPCEARQGRVSMEDDCERERTCAVDVRVDGGTAGCDAVGSDETKAGDGEGRRAGEGGLCEADANGGAVAIGDVNP
jgi:hypothetical protein